MPPLKKNSNIGVTQIKGQSKLPFGVSPDSSSTPAVPGIDRPIPGLSKLDTAGPYLKQAKAAIAERKFKGISLGANTKVDIEISQGQFFRSLVANLRSRMETTAASNVGINENARASDIHKYNNLLASIEVLNKYNWKGKEQDELYGESDIQLLCDRMSINSRNFILGFREFRNSISQLEQANVNGTAHTPTAV